MEINRARKTQQDIGQDQAANQIDVLTDGHRKPLFRLFVSRVAHRKPLPLWRMVTSRWPAGS